MVTTTTAAVQEQQEQEAPAHYHLQGRIRKGGRRRRRTSFPNTSSNSNRTMTKEWSISLLLVALFVGSHARLPTVHGMSSSTNTSTSTSTSSSALATTTATAFQHAPTVLVAAATVAAPAGPIGEAVSCNIEELEEANDSQLHAILVDLTRTQFFKTFVVDLEQHCPLAVWRKKSSSSSSSTSSTSTSTTKEEKGETSSSTATSETKTSTTSSSSSREEMSFSSSQQQVDDDDDEDEFDCSGGAAIVLGDELDDDAEPLCTVAALPADLFDSNALHSLQQDGFQSVEQKKTYTWKQHVDKVVLDEAQPDDCTTTTAATATAGTTTSTTAADKNADLVSTSGSSATTTATTSSATASAAASVTSAADGGALPDLFWMDLCAGLNNGDWKNAVDLQLNPEHNTGYNGTHIWRAIYEENCVVSTSTGTNNNNDDEDNDNDNNNDNPMCFEERVLYRLLSGLHTSTTVSIARHYYPPSARKGRTVWMPNPTYFMEKLGGLPGSSVSPAVAAERIRNLHFSYVVLLRALQKASPALYRYKIQTGNIVEDEKATVLLRRLLDSSILQTCQNVFTAFDESLMFHDGEDNDETDTIVEVLSKGSASNNKKKKKKNVATLQHNFKGIFHNVSSILDCVQCQQCKLHGKLAMLGYGTALKALFLKEQTLASAAASSSSTSSSAQDVLFDRNEIVALVNTLAKLSESIRHVRELTSMYWQSQRYEQLQQQQHLEQLQQQQQLQLEYQEQQRRRLLATANAQRNDASESTSKGEYSSINNYHDGASDSNRESSSSYATSYNVVDTAVGLIAAMGRQGLITPEREVQLVQLALHQRSPDILILAKHYAAHPDAVQTFFRLTQPIGTSSSSSSTVAMVQQSDVPDAIVVGSGLAGLAATLHILDRGGTVILIEKEHLLGGNSNKASSGINGCCLPEDKEYGDSIDLFRNDTTRSAGTSARPDLIDTLVQNSAQAITWLRQRAGVDLSLLSQLGGHSAKRTHRPNNGMAGAEIIYGLSKQVRAFVKSGKVQILTDTKVTKLLTEETATGEVRVIGVEYMNLLDNTKKEQRAPNVILATGGFASDRSSGSLLERYRPELLHMPTTAGPFSTGDGIGLATSLGAGVVDMGKVQLHPTGWVDPADPDNTSKILAAELMRGVGGILLNDEGKRFCNELGTRAYVTDEMLKHNPHYRETKLWERDVPIPSFALILSSSAAQEGRKHVDLYTHKGLLKELHGVSELAAWMGRGVNVETVRASLQQYQKDAAAGKDAFGKTFFRGIFDDDLDTETFYAGRVTPVLHYCMGGLTIDTEGNVLNEQGKPISGLHAAGEVTGGVHGVNRLGGNSLLECTVYGTIVGSKIPIQSHLRNSNNNGAANQRQEAAGASANSKDGLRAVSMSELSKHNTPQDCWVAIHGVVYDMTHFAQEHPAGPESIHKLAGTDGTAAFQAVHNERILEEFDDDIVGALVRNDNDNNNNNNQDNNAGGQGDGLRAISLQELQKHKSKNDIWVAVHGKVYDLTDFVPEHPGGPDALLKLAGTDGTKAFMSVHNPKILENLQEEIVGRFQPSATSIN